MIQIPLAVYLLFLAPLTALAFGFFILRPWKPEWTHIPILISCVVVTISTAFLAAFVYSGHGLDGTLFRWMMAGDWSIVFGVRVDGIGVAVLSMVSLVGALIHFYAAGYMKGDPGFSRFFLFFHLFYLAMIGLLVSNNYVQFYLFWELVGACSYFLIAHWLHKPTARRAALQAFMTNRVGDFGLMLAVLLILARYHNTRFAMLYTIAPGMAPELLALSGFLFFWAAAAKSAQFPLYFWLPDAMEGPTPVSALMHAATMVTAGIFLLVRSWPLIGSVPGLPNFIAAVGAATAIGAALLACTQKDLKRILAYSTVSHLGLMAFALGLGQVAAALFHLVVHGFFKAALFLCAGNVAHGSGKPTVSVDEAGGLKRSLPLTYACFAIAAMSLAGVWPLAGFYSKDAILDAACERGPWAMAAGLAIAMGGALYISRMLFLTFFGPRAEQKPGEHVHEAPLIMILPVALIVVGAFSVGWLGRHFTHLLLSGWPETVPLPVLPELSAKVSGMGLAAMGCGVAISYVLTMRLPSFDWDWRRRHPGLEAAFACDLGWRKVVAWFAAVVVRGADRIGRVFDHEVLDAAIEKSADACQKLSQTGSSLATGSL